MSGPRAPHSLRHEPQSTPLKFEEPLKVISALTTLRLSFWLRIDRRQTISG